MPKILYTSTAVRNKIVELFESSRSRRVVITAFIGDGVETYLPNPTRVDVICWPKAGGTNPDSIRRLIETGARVYFSNSLHMKVYWTKDKGAVITSANLSQNALGSGNLKEIGIWLEPGKVDIDRILSSLRYWKVSKDDLFQLDHAHREYHIRNRLKRSFADSQTFAEWYQAPHPPKWRICWWGYQYIELAKAAKDILEKKYGVSTAYDFLNSTSRDDYPKGSWVLCFTGYLDSLARFSWMYVDRAVHVAKSDKQAYTAGYEYQFIQIWPPKRYPLPPFKIDNKFRRAFRSAAKKVGLERVEYLVKPTNSLLELVYQYYE